MGVYRKGGAVLPIIIESRDRWHKVHIQYVVSMVLNGACPNLSQ